MIERPQRAMVVFAHPDDEMGCSGTVASWAKGGTAILFVVCTNGDKGSEDPNMSTEQMAQIREHEMREAASVLGVQEIVFLGHPDGDLEDNRELRGEIVREIRRFRPDIVLCQDIISRNPHNHRDHRVCATVTLDALFPYARDPLHFQELTQEGLHPHKVSTVLCWGSAHPTEYVDVSDVMEIKIASMLRHRSQFLERPSRDPKREPWETMLENARFLGNQGGSEYAEAFRMIEFRV